MQDRELTVLIRDEADRIRALVDRMEVFDEKPIERAGGEYPPGAGARAQGSRRPGSRRICASVEAYDPSLPSVLGNRDQLVQVVLNLVKNAAESITAGAAAGMLRSMTGEITLMTRLPARDAPGDTRGRTGPSDASAAGR